VVKGAGSGVVDVLGVVEWAGAGQVRVRILHEWAGIGAGKGASASGVFEGHCSALVRG